jgi:hypothetical protein
MKNKTKNKKAQMGSAILWFYKILMLVFVIGGIIFIVSAHYAKHYDIREVEASIVSAKVADCFIDKGKMNKEDFSQDTLTTCLIFDEDEVFVNVTLIQENKQQESISLGREHLKVYCEAKEQGTEGKHFPVCLEQDYDVLLDDTSSKLSIFVAILKLSKNE